MLKLQLFKNQSSCKYSLYVVNRIVFFLQITWKMCVDINCSPLIMHTDPDLPLGWKRKVVKRMKDNRYDVYIFSPKGKRFRSKKQLQEFLSNDEKLNLTMDQFSFSLTKDKQGPKHRLTKLERTLTSCDSQQKCTNYPDDMSVLATKNLSRPLTPENVTILKPLPNFMIKVFPHPPVYQGYVSNEEDAVKNHPMDVKNFVRKEALKTLLSICESEKDNADTVPVKDDTEERPLTELEELDLYFDFDYDKDNKNKKIIDIRSVFDSDSEDEHEMMI